MGNFTNLYVVLIACVGACNVYAKRERPPSLRDPISYSMGNKISSFYISNKLYDHRNLMENNECIHHLCYNITNYPSSSVKDIITRNKDFHHLFGSVIRPYSPPTLSPKFTSNEDENMCAVLTYTVRPQTALNKSTKRVVVANVDDYKQEVSFEVCVPNTKCFMDDHKPAQFETACKQQYTVVKLVTVAENGQLTLDSVPIPSSCVCTYRGSV
ncbi:hypothetical protein RI129_000241 [Pyrocoelia pectoralis]|uniref:Spaetzle domain-containing protein n=1 Tax=Pyrocoelia pectoralis TaxID=417401 RepID=A0AAN7VIX2_9COLE